MRPIDWVLFILVLLAYLLLGFALIETADMPKNEIDYRYRVTVPVRDFSRPDTPIAFLVDVYGLTSRELSLIGPDTPCSRPIRRAIERLRLDPNRYAATLWDL